MMITTSVARDLCQEGPELIEPYCILVVNHTWALQRKEGRAQKPIVSIPHIVAYTLHSNILSNH